jgi:hypothetical protein
MIVCDYYIAYPWGKWVKARIGGESPDHCDQFARIGATGLLSKEMGRPIGIVRSPVATGSPDMPSETGPCRRNYGVLFHELLDDSTLPPWVDRKEIEPIPIDE